MSGPPQTEGGLCILITVFERYRPLAPLMVRLLDRFWPGHPPVFLCGGAGGLEDCGEVLPLEPGVAGSDWVAFTRDAAALLQARGFHACYLLCEEHVPLEPCHAAHLNVTLPDLIRSLDARYIGLMGWDNRRYVSKAPVLGPGLHRLKHLTLTRDPRFHLHPALWRIDTLVRVCDLVMPLPDRSPWRLEKTADLPDAPLPAEDRTGCYQVCAATMGTHPLTRLALARHRLTNQFFKRAMAFYPPLQRIGLGQWFWDRMGFDAFLFRGPYPLYFSGIMCKGRPNPHLLRWLAGSPARRGLLREIEAATDLLVRG